MENKYYWSDVEDSSLYEGPFNSVNECIEDAKLELEDDCKHIFIGEAGSVGVVFNAESVLEDIADNLDCNGYEDAGELWLMSISDKTKLEDEIEKAVIEVLKRNKINTSVTIITNIKKHLLTPDTNSGEEGRV